MKGDHELNSYENPKTRKKKFLKRKEKKEEEEILSLEHLT